MFNKNKLRQIQSTNKEYNIFLDFEVSLIILHIYV